jgi:hypothetical protein
LASYRHEFHTSMLSIARSCRLKRGVRILLRRDLFVRRILVLTPCIEWLMFSRFRFPERLRYFPANSQCRPNFRGFNNQQFISQITLGKSHCRAYDLLSDFRVFQHLQRRRSCQGTWAFIFVSRYPARRDRVPSCTFSGQQAQTAPQ